MINHPSQKLVYRSQRAVLLSLYDFPTVSSLAGRAEGQSCEYKTSWGGKARRLEKERGGGNES